MISFTTPRTHGQWKAGHGKTDNTRKHFRLQINSFRSEKKRKKLKNSIIYLCLSTIPVNSAYDRISGYCWCCCCYIVSHITHNPQIEIAYILPFIAFLRIYFCWLNAQTKRSEREPHHPYDCGKRERRHTYTQAIPEKSFLMKSPIFFRCCCCCCCWATLQTNELSITAVLFECT